jgi:hypothetical protein
MDLIASSVRMNCFCAQQPQQHRCRPQQTATLIHQAELYRGCVSGIYCGTANANTPVLRNAIMSAKTSQDYYRDLAWLYGGSGLAG